MGLHPLHGPVPALSCNPLPTGFADDMHRTIGTQTGDAPGGRAEARGAPPCPSSRRPLFSCPCPTLYRWGLHVGPVGHCNGDNWGWPRSTSRLLPPAPPPLPLMAQAQQQQVNAIICTCHSTRTSHGVPAQGVHRCTFCRPAPRFGRRDGPAHGPGPGRCSAPPHVWRSSGPGPFCVFITRTERCQLSECPVPTD